MVRLLEYIGEALDALMRNKTRTILTMLGIFIGVGAVDAVFALSTGAAAAINSSVSSGDQPALTIYPEPNQRNPDQASINYRDAALVMNAGNGVIRRVIPYYTLQVRATHIFNVRQSSGSQKNIAFGFSWYGDDANLFTAAGRAFSPAEVDGAANVCLLSPDLAYKFNGSYDAAIGTYVIIGGSRYRVIGVTDKSHGTAANEFGGTYYFVLPYSTFHILSPGKVDALQVWDTSPQDEGAAKDAAIAALKHLHGESSDYHVDSTREQLEQSDKILNIVAASLTAIGAISLLVAGIGIMNIMLVSIAERTREIGIRKSIGAKRRDIALQFLAEAVLMALAGGGMGLLLALGIIAIAANALRDKFGEFLIPYAAVVFLAFAFSLIVGVFFGAYPAVRASRLDPVEALRS